MTEPSTPTEVGTPPIQTFSAEYVKELRAENKATRLRAQDLETQLKQAQEAGDNLAASYTAKAAALTAEAQVAMTRAELKVHALRAGMVDLDGLKLLDLSKISLNDQGEIENADAVLKQAKDVKPWLFGVQHTTSSTAQPPKPADVKEKHALEMSADELHRFERQHGILVR